MQTRKPPVSLKFQLQRIWMRAYSVFNRDDGSITWIATDHTITDREMEALKDGKGV